MFLDFMKRYGKMKKANFPQRLYDYDIEQIVQYENQIVEEYGFTKK